MAGGWKFVEEEQFKEHEDMQKSKHENK
jgi:hypothetical protein